MPSVRHATLAVLSAWHGLAAFKNICDLCAAFDIVPQARPFGSKNFVAIEKLLAPLALPRPLVGGLLGGAALTELVIAVAFARGRGELGTALAVLLFGSFALVDEAMADYQLDETHREILTFVLLGYLIVRTERAAGD